jgi:hypothetical protein
MSGSDTEAIKKGLDGYLTKPVNSNMLRDCINEFTRFQI